MSQPKKNKRGAMKDMGKLWAQAIKLGDVTITKHVTRCSQRIIFTCSIKFGGDEALGVSFQHSTIAVAMQKAVNKAIEKQKRDAP